MTPRTTAAPKAGTAAEILPARPFKPRKGLFILLATLLALWIVCLIVMYFTTVRPYRHPPTPAAKGAVRQEF